MPSRYSPNDTGATWIELLIDFELSTRCMIDRKGPGSRATHMHKRALDFAKATRKIVYICGKHKLPIGRVGSLTPFGARWQAGFPKIPALLNPLEVTLEVAHQAINHRASFDVGAPTQNHWKWPPIYRQMPKPKWHAVPVDLEKLVAPRRRVTGKRKIIDLGVTLSTLTNDPGGEDSGRHLEILCKRSLKRRRVSSGGSGVATALCRAP